MLVPSGLMLLPESDIVTPDTKQILIAIWQPWPAYVAILLWLAYSTPGLFNSDHGSLDTQGNSRRALRYSYAFAFANCAIPHIVCVTISFATVVSPAIFDGRYVEALHPSKVFDTPLPWASPLVRVETVGQGVHTFLRWDYIIGSLGVLVWAISLYKAAHQSTYGHVDGFGLLIKSTLLTLLAGPVGAAVELVWERDELVLHAGSVKADKGNKK